MKEQKINLLAVLVAVVIQFVLGFFWYGAFFGESWMGMVGLDLATIEANPPGAGVWITSVAESVLSMSVLAWLFVRLKVNSLAIGIWLGFVVGFSLVLMSGMVSGMYADDPYWLNWINGGYTTVGLMLGGAVLGIWPGYKA